MVFRNRLEQLRKRQRDEGLQAQEELLAGVAQSASNAWGSESVPPPVVPDTISSEEIEEYDPVMSPTLLDITKLPLEERDIDILTEKEVLRTLVCSLS